MWRFVVFLDGTITSGGECSSLVDRVSWWCVLCLGGGGYVLILCPVGNEPVLIWGTPLSRATVLIVVFFSALEMMALKERSLRRENDLFDSEVRRIQARGARCKPGVEGSCARGAERS